MKGFGTFHPVGRSSGEVRSFYDIGCSFRETITRRRRDNGEIGDEVVDWRKVSGAVRIARLGPSRVKLFAQIPRSAMRKHRSHQLERGEYNAPEVQDLVSPPPSPL